MSSRKTSLGFPGILIFGVFLTGIALSPGCRPAAQPGEAPAPAAAVVDPAILAEGERVYNEYCAQCHLAGEGTPGLNPPLTDSTILKGSAYAGIKNILKGSQGQTVIKGQRFSGMMAPLDYLTDDEIAAVLTYVRQLYGKNPAPLVTPQEVAQAR